MHCPFCRHTDSRVMDSRTTDDGSSIRRRRQCPECGRRFTTIETASPGRASRSTPAVVYVNDAVDPTAKIPEYKVCAVQVEKLGIRNYELGIGGDHEPSLILNP